MSELRRTSLRVKTKLPKQLAAIVNLGEDYKSIKHQFIFLRIATLVSICVVGGNSVIIEVI